MPKHHLRRGLKRRGVLPNELEDRQWQSQHKIEFTSMEELVDSDQASKPIPKIFVDPEFRRIRKNDGVSKFAQDFYEWNKTAMWVMNNISYPYEAMQELLARMVMKYYGKVWADLGSGSCDFCARMLSINGKRVEKIFALDFDWRMLAEAPYTLKRAGFSGRVALIQGSSHLKMPIWDHKVDTVISSLGATTYSGWWFQDGRLVCEGEEALIQHLWDVNRIMKDGGVFALSSMKPNPEFGAILKESLLFPLRNLQFRRLYNAIKYGPNIKRISSFMNEAAMQGRAHYLSIEEWVNALQKSGFEIIDHADSYAGQGLVIVARKIR